MLKNIFIGFFGFFLLSSQTLAQQIPTLEFFHGAECPHCHEEKKWFSELKQMYPDIQIKEYEVWHNPENKIIAQKRLQAIGEPFSGVPTNIVGDQVIVGFMPEAILALLEVNYGPPLKKIPPPIQKIESNWKQYLNSSWPIMSFVLGLLDGFNPCAMWSLFILLGFLLSMEDKSKRWLVGGIFIGSSALIYFAALTAYLYGFQEISTFVASSIMGWIFRAVGLLAIVSGLIALRSSTKSNIDCDIRDAKSKKKFHSKLSEILAREKMIFVLMGVVGLAFSVNAIELLCSFAIPTAFTATLISTGLSTFEKFSAILIYDFAYMLDDLIIFTIAMWTMSLKVLSPKIVQGSHLIGGIILILLGVGLFFNPEMLSTLLT